VLLESFLHQQEVGKPYEIPVVWKQNYHDTESICHCHTCNWGKLLCFPCAFFKQSSPHPIYTRRHAHTHARTYIYV